MIPHDRNDPRNVLSQIISDPTIPPNQVERATSLLRRLNEAALTDSPFADLASSLGESNQSGPSHYDDLTLHDVESRLVALRGDWVAV